MKSLTVLGGSAAGIGTGQGCSGYLVQTESTSIVLDLGPGTALELRKHTDFRRLDAIVISHLHMDHVLDLFTLRFALAYNPIRLPKPVPLLLPPGGLDFMKRAEALWVDSSPGEESDYFTAVYEMSEYDPTREIEIGDFVIRFAPTAHVIPCWAIRVQARDGSDDLFYTADTGIDADLDEIANGAAVIIAEAAAPSGSNVEKMRHMHFMPEQAAALAERAGARNLVLTHIWEENDPATQAAAARAHFTGRMTVAVPGVTITW
jgi:ribonuclease BN (tRNA processing enzyme)